MITGLFAIIALAACTIRATWTVRWDGSRHFDDSAVGIALDPERHVVVVASTTDYEPGNAEPGDIVVLEYTQDGTLRWSTQVGHAPGSRDFVFGTAIDERGTVYAVGTGPAEDGGILAVDTTGQLLFRDALPGVAYDVTVGARAVCVTGAEATTGYARDGELLWQAAHPRAAGRAIVIDGAGQVWVAGSIAEASAGEDDAWWQRDAWLAKYAPDGTLLWQRVFGVAGSEDGLRAVAVDASGHYYATGRVTSATGVGDFFLVRGAPSGAELWQVRDDVASAFLERGDDVIVDASGHAIVVSMSYSTSTSAVRTTRRYAPDGRVVWSSRTTGISDLNTDMHFHRAQLDAAGRVYVTGTALTVVLDGANGRELARAAGPTVSDSFLAIDGTRVFVAESERRGGYLDVRLSRYEP